MKFERVHKWVLYALLVIGFLPLSASGEVPAPVVVLFHGGIVASWFVAVPYHATTQRRRWGSRLSLAVFALSLTVGLTQGQVVLPAFCFVLAMAVIRLFQSRDGRAVFQLYALSFLGLIAGAVVNPTMVFLLAFLPYIVVLTWALVLLHLQRNIEMLASERGHAGEHGEALGWQARSLVTPRFLLGSSGLALLVFAASLVIFLFFPRLGMGFFLGQGRATKHVSGFSDRIELGHFGTIKDNMQVIMRVEVPDEAQPGARQLRMRGMTFDTYDGRMWSKSSEVKHRYEMTRAEDQRWVVTRGRGSRDVTEFSAPLIQDVYLEPLDVDRRVVFAEPNVHALAINNPNLDRLKRDRVVFYQDLSGDLSTAGRVDTALRYRVYSYPPVLDEAQLPTKAPRLGRPMRRLLRRYLQLPKALDPRIEALAARVVRDEGATTALTKISALRRHLEETLSYSTLGGHDRADPLADFLFKRQQGHCEFFASALAVMLRTQGVPARPVNGFYGGAYNTYGDFYAVRQADAHSWVEAWVPGYGWWTVDPTPAAEVLVPPEEGVWSAVEAFVDSIRLRWYKWIVEFDLEKQLQMLRAIGDIFSDLFSDDDAEEEADVASQSNPEADAEWSWLGSPALWLSLLFAVLCFAVWRLRGLARLMRWWRQRQAWKSMGSLGRMLRLYARLQRLLARQGYRRAPGETPRELAARIDSAGYVAATDVSLLTAAFERVRYAGQSIPHTEWQELNAAMSRVKRARHEGPR